MPISYTTSQNNELFWEGSQCLKSLVICDLRFESQIAIAIKLRDLEHLVMDRQHTKLVRRQLSLSNWYRNMAIHVICPDTFWYCEGVACTRTSTSSAWEYTKVCFVAARCNVVKICDLRLKQHQPEGYLKLCCCLPHTMLTAPLTNSVRKRRPFSDLNSWRSYDQCLFFSCLVFSIHVNMGDCMNVRMPVCAASTALPISLSSVSVFDRFNVPFPS